MIYIPIFNYECLACGEVFEAIVIYGQSGFGEPPVCPKCQAVTITKVITAPASIRTDGRTALQSLPDPHAPLQELRGRNRPDCEGGFSDLPETGKMERKKTKDGNWTWREKKTQVFDFGKK